jgi:hypothetical protein
VARSLWDRSSLLAHIDVEYVNLESPAAAYTSPERTFGAQAAAVSALESSLADLGIAPLKLLSGRGHHLVWAVRRDSRAFARLARLGRLPAHLRATYSQPVGKTLEEAREARMLLRDILRRLDTSAPPTVEGASSPAAWGPHGRPKM